ncbi:uncharacterized protein LOC144099570 isoform X2 [Amblyomma americanum]
MTRRLAHKLESQWRSQDVLQSEEKATFDEFLLSQRVLSGLRKAGFIRPSPIQLRAIPLGLCGFDMVVQAKSGTGKTCVFSVLALQAVNTSRNAIQVLILAPTREIAVQSCDTVRCLGCDTPGLEVYAFIGGVSVREDVRKLARCHVAVGTMGRLLQLVKQGKLCLDGVRLLVLDEADQLLGESFQEGLRELWARLPERFQTVATSATYPPKVARTLEHELLNKPVIVRLADGTPALLGVSQWYCVADRTDEVAWFPRKLCALENILRRQPFSQCLVFLNSQARAQSLADRLSHAGFPAQLLSGAQDQEQRLKALVQLKAFRCRILVSTDLAARGIDAERVNLVVHFDVARDLETHLHRSGRAGRYGSAGQAVTLVTGLAELGQLQELCSPLGLDIKPMPEPHHDLCPEGADSWCCHKAAEANGLPQPGTGFPSLEDVSSEFKVNGGAAESVSKEVCSQAPESSMDIVELPPMEDTCPTEDVLQPTTTESGHLQPVIAERGLLRPTMTEGACLQPRSTGSGLLRPTMGPLLTFQEALSGKKAGPPVQPILPWPPDPSLGKALATRIAEEKEAFCRAYNITFRPGTTLRLATGGGSDDSSTPQSGTEASAGNRQGKTEVGEDSCVLPLDADQSTCQEQQAESSIAEEAGQASAMPQLDTDVEQRTFQMQQEASSAALASDVLCTKQADAEPETFPLPLQLSSTDLESEPTITREVQGEEDTVESCPDENAGNLGMTEATGGRGHVRHCTLQESNSVLSESQQQSFEQKGVGKTRSSDSYSPQLKPNIAAVEFIHTGPGKMKERKSVSYGGKQRLKSTSSDEADDEVHAVSCARRSRRHEQQSFSRSPLNSPRSPSPSLMTHFSLAGGDSNLPQTYPAATAGLCYQCTQKCDDIRAACHREQHSTWTTMANMWFPSWTHTQPSAAAAYLDWSQNWFRWHQWYIRKMLEANGWY